jgi:hypothetical protein
MTSDCSDRCADPRPGEDGPIGLYSPPPPLARNAAMAVTSNRSNAR